LHNLVRVYSYSKGLFFANFTQEYFLQRSRTRVLLQTLDSSFTKSQHMSTLTEIVGISQNVEKRFRKGGEVKSICINKILRSF